MINHVTVHVPPETLNDPALLTFMTMLRMEEVKPDDPFEHGWEVRWFKNKAAEPPAQTYLHLVAGEHMNHHGFVQDVLCLGHICIDAVEVDMVRQIARQMGWLERDSGSGRIWLNFYNLRVEVRP